MLSLLVPHSAACWTETCREYTNKNMALVGDIVAAMLLTAHLDRKQINQKCDTCVRAFQVLLCRYEFKFNLLNYATLSSSTSFGSVYIFETQQRSIATKVLETLLQMTWNGDSVGGIANWYRLDGPEIESRFSTSLQNGSEDHSASYTMGTGSHTSGYSGQGVMMTTQPHLTPRSEKGQSYTSTPPLPFHCLF
jgi:hypothetical protein